jgi:16S rRNA (adenine1518-N6/adenine1519-N6)-dimethyltransferase|tara:strand:+ start:5946 stop:6752 length:807 start_codon:yes stop_codon:yes gene_type:complete
MSDSSGLPIHKARKRFGQNFLVDSDVIDLIIKAIQPKKEDNLIEIGAGKGAITETILENCPSLKIIELDRDLVVVLKNKFKNYDECKIQQGNALEVDYRKFFSAGCPLRIIGNLPYNITTPLLFHLLGFHKYIADMHFMLQKEVVDRISASPGNKNYGRLSVMIQYYCNVHPLFLVPPSAFSPSPKVDSMIVLLCPYKEIPYIAENLQFFSKLIKICFQQRRKTIRNSIKLLLSEEHIEKLSIDLTLRPEQFSVAQFVSLSNQIGLLL